MCCADVSSVVIRVWIYRGEGTWMRSWASWRWHCAVPLALLTAAHTWCHGKAQCCLLPSKVTASGLTYVTGVQGMMLRSSHVCRSCRGLVIRDPCQPQGKDISFSYFAVNLLPDKRVCPWKAFYLGETVSVVLLFHVKLILMQHLLIQKHSVLQAKKSYLYSVKFLHQDKLWNAVTTLLQHFCLTECMYLLCVGKN